MHINRLRYAQEQVRHTRACGTPSDALVRGHTCDGAAAGVVAAAASLAVTWSDGSASGAAGASRIATGAGTVP